MSEVVHFARATAMAVPPTARARGALGTQGSAPHHCSLGAFPTCVGSVPGCHIQGCRQCCSRDPCTPNLAWNMSMSMD